MQTRRLARFTTPAAPLAAAALMLFASLPAAHAASAQPESLDLNRIMEKNAMVSKVLGSMSNATFTLINASGEQRERQTFLTSKLEPNGIDNMRMTRFTSPPDIKDTATLTVEHADGDDDIWIYLPALKKVRRLVASNKKDSFVGTDFAYADVIGFRVNEWKYHLARTESLDNSPCYVIESTPASPTVADNTGYSKRIDWIRQDNMMTLKSEYWDQAGAPLKTIRFTDVQQVDPAHEKWQAMQMEALNKQTGHRTVIRFDNFKVNAQIKSDYFSTRYLEAK